MLQSYIEFTSEIFKFSMAGIAAIWAVVLAVKKVENKPLQVPSCDPFIWLAIASVGFLIITCCFALAHRYVASNSMANWTDLIRKRDTWKKDSTWRKKKRVIKLYLIRNFEFKMSRNLVIFSALSLIISLVLIAVMLSTL